MNQTAVYKHETTSSAATCVCNQLNTVKLMKRRPYIHILCTITYMKPVQFFEGASAEFINNTSTQ